MKLTDTEIKTACLDKISGLAASMITEFNKMDLEDEEDLYWFADKGTRMFESISRLSSFSKMATCLHEYKHVPCVGDSYEDFIVCKMCGKTVEILCPDLFVSSCDM